MALRGEDQRSLARATGYTLGTIRQVLNGSTRHVGAAREIDRVLDCRIFTTPAIFRTMKEKP